MNDSTTNHQKVNTATTPRASGLSKRLQAVTSNLTSLMLVIFIALLVGAGLMLLSGQSPAEAYKCMLLGAFGSVPLFTETLVKTIPLLLMGLAVSIAFKGSFWNIGGEGQFLAGAVFSTWVALNFVFLPSQLLSIICFVAGFVGGAVWCLIPGILKVKFNVNEVISTLMMSYVAQYLTMYLIRGPMRDMTSKQYSGMVFPQTALIPDTLWLPKLIEKTRLHAGLIIVLLILVFVWLLWRTRYGFEIELSGANREAARYSGVSVNRVIILVAVLSGGLAGLVGWNEVFGVHHRVLDAITGGYGYMGIVVALLAQMNPFAIIISALLFSVLTVGGAAMERATGVSFAVVNTINGFIIVFLLLRVMVQRRILGEE